MQFSFIPSWLQNLAGYSSSSRPGRLNSDNSQGIVLQKDKNVARVPRDQLGVVNMEKLTPDNSQVSRFSFIPSWLQNVAGYLSSFLPGRHKSPSDDWPTIDSLIAARAPEYAVKGSKTEQIYYACTEGDKWLLEHWVTKERLKNIPQTDLNKLLVLAIQASNSLMVSKLMEAGADVNIELEHAVELWVWNHYGFLSSSNAGIKVSKHFIEQNALKKIQFLVVDCGADINALDKNGKTLLHHAILKWFGLFNKGNCDILELLIQCRADVNAQDKNGKTPLYYAAKRGFKQAVALLINSGAKVNAKDKNGQTALHHAAASMSQWSGNSIALLIDSGAKVNAKDKNGKTALIHAVDRIVQNLDDISLLLTKGASLDVIDEDGNNVSHQILSKYIAQPNDKLAQLFYRILECPGVLTQQNAQGKTLCNLLVENWSSLDINFLQQVLYCLEVSVDDMEGMGHDELQEYFISVMQPRTKSARNVGESPPSDTKQEMPEESEEVALAGEGDSDNEN